MNSDDAISENYVNVDVQTMGFPTDEDISESVIENHRANIKGKLTM